MPSFTHRVPNLERLGPITEVVLGPSVPFLRAMGANYTEIKTTKVVAMIDTGASSTVISQGIAESLGINPVGITSIHTPSSTNVQCYQYDIQVNFANNVSITSLVVTEAPLQGQHIQCLIGRDLLQYAVLIYTGHDNSFTLSF